MANDSIIKQIMDLPEAVLLVQQVQDRLADEQRKRHEFYEMIGEDDKAEFINGEVEFHSPVVKWHTDATKRILKLLDDFVDLHDLGYVGVEKTMITLTRNDYEPDVCYFGPAKAATFKPDQMLYPAPDLVVEVLSKSNQRNIDRDRVVKYADYEAHGIPEYWMVDPELKTVEQYLLRNGKYELQLKATQGDIASETLPNFVIPIAAIFDKKLNLKVRRGWQ